MFSYFTKYSFVIWVVWFVLILVAIIFKLEYADNSSFYIKLLVEMLSTTWVSLLIASFFSYTTSTKEFIDNITQYLKDIVIDKTFLANLDGISKIQALSSLIKPSNQDKQVYSHIENYYDKFIQEVLDVTKKNIRTEYVVTSEVLYDKTHKRLFCRNKIRYRLYPSIHWYEPIKIQFELKDALSNCKRIIVWSWSQTSLIDLNETKIKEQEHEEWSMRKIEIELNNSSIKECEHLVVNIDLVEYWIENEDSYLCSFKSLLPTEGFNFTLKYEEWLRVLEHHFFSYWVDAVINENPWVDLQYIVNWWLQQGTAIVFLLKKVTSE